MKKLYYILFIAASVLATACAKEVSIDDTSSIETPSEIIVPEETVTYTFTVNASAKSSLTNGGAFSWVAGDHIAIYNSATSSYVTFSVTSVDGSGNATITADAAAGAVWTNAIYPAERATGAGNGVDYAVQTVSGPILVSKVDGQTLSFKYLGAVANIQVNDVPGEPTKLTFTANANVFGSRTFSWSGETPVLGGEGSQASITVPFTSNTIISVPIPQVSYAGFTITVDNAAGRHLYKKTTANTFDMSSKKLLPMPTLTYAEPGYYVKTTSTTAYWDTECARMIKTGANTYVLSENCDGNSTYYIFDEYNTDQPTTCYLVSALARATGSGVSSWGLVGEGFDGSTWDPANPIAMQYEGGWQFVKNIKFTKEWPQIKFVIGGGWNNAIGSSVTHSNSSSDNNVYVGEYGEIATQSNSAGNIYVGNVTPNTEYDIFLDPTNHEVRIFLSSAAYDPNEASGIWQFTYDSSLKTATHEWKCDVLDYPLGNSGFPTTTYGIKGSWDSWSTPHTSGTTYNDNQSWVISNFEPGASGSFSFGLCDSSSNHWTDLSSDGSFATVNPGENLYGTLTYWRDNGHSNPSVTLENARYTVFVNVNPDVNGGVNLMFVKQ